ncbi:unnamed protein product [Linum trigynum]|uniref:Uncharacterized protein n=1 Tax=Linum trigynum TaxID=586398 RepID=A0AAV2DR27_9ROSI
MDDPLVLTDLDGSHFTQPSPLTRTEGDTKPRSEINHYFKRHKETQPAIPKSSIDKGRRERQRRGREGIDGMGWSIGSSCVSICCYCRCAVMCCYWAAVDVLLPVMGSSFFSVKICLL